MNDPTQAPRDTGSLRLKVKLTPEIFRLLMGHLEAAPGTDMPQKFEHVLKAVDAQALASLAN